MRPLFQQIKGMKRILRPLQICVMIKNKVLGRKFPDKKQCIGEETTMRNPNDWIKTLCWVIAFLILVTLALGMEQAAGRSAKEVAIARRVEAAEETNGFVCYTTDDAGQIYFAHWSEKDRQWYLFVPAAQSIEDVVLSFNGEINEVSEGVLDPEKKTVTGGFAADEDTLLLTSDDGQKWKVTVQQSTLPCVHIELGGTTLNQIHENQANVFGGNSIRITDPLGRWDLPVQSNLLIRGRGNSSWREFEKKGYQIEFRQDTSIMGMRAAKRWVLMSNSGDISLMRTKLVSDAVKDMGMGFVPSFEYVDLWIDGEYLGVYLLGEKVEVGPARLDMKHAMGALFEHDEAFYEEEPIRFLSKPMNRHFVVKQTVGQADEIPWLAMEVFEESVDRLIQFLYATPSEQITLEDLSEMIDVDSFALYYLINEYVLNCESFSTSFYWYQDGPEDVLHLGPVWDFDTCMGNDLATADTSFGNQHVMFRYLLAIPAFCERAEQLFEQIRPELENMSRRIDEMGNRIGSSARMNYLRWEILGAPNPKTGENFSKTYTEEMTQLRMWLEERKDGFRITREKVATSVVRGDSRTITLRYCGEETEEILFALWIGTGETEQKKWYRAQKGEDGAWYAEADLGYFNRAGVYYFDAYAGNRELLASGRNYVPQSTQTGITVGESAIPLYRMTGPDGENIYTADEAERTQLEMRDWSVDQIVCYVPTAWGVPVYRLYNPSADAYHYTMSWEERNALVSQGWYNQGVCWNSDSSQVPVYRLWGPESGHFFTADENERDDLLQQGFNLEGIGWYGIMPLE